MMPNKHAAYTMNRLNLFATATFALVPAFWAIVFVVEPSSEFFDFFVGKEQFGFAFLTAISLFFLVRVFKESDKKKKVFKFIPLAMVVYVPAFVTCISIAYVFMVHE